MTNHCGKLDWMETHASGALAFTLVLDSGVAMKKSDYQRQQQCGLDISGYFLSINNIGFNKETLVSHPIYKQYQIFIVNSQCWFGQSKTLVSTQHFGQLCFQENKLSHTMQTDFILGTSKETSKFCLVSLN